MKVIVLGQDGPAVSITTDWRAKLAQATQIRTQIATRLGPQPLPAVVEIIRPAREEREEQFSDWYGCPYRRAVGDRNSE